MYALYQGDEFLDLGTIEYLTKKFNITENTLRFYSSKAYLKRVEGKKDGFKNCRIAIRI